MKFKSRFAKGMCVLSLLACSESSKNSPAGHSDVVIASNATPTNGNGSITFNTDGKSLKVLEDTPLTSIAVAIGKSDSINHRITVVFDNNSGKIRSVIHSWSQNDVVTSPEATTNCEDTDCSLVKMDVGSGRLDFNGVVLKSSSTPSVGSSLSEHLHFK